MVTPNPETQEQEFDLSDSEAAQALGWEETSADDLQPPPEPQPAPQPAPQPEPQPTPQPPQQPAPQQDAFRQQQEQQRQQQQDQLVSQHIETQAGQYMSALLNQGHDQQTAYQQAKVWAESQWNRWESVKAQDQAKKATLHAKQYEVSQKYGVPLEQLQSFDNESAMEQHAKLYKEIHQVRQEASAGNRAPVQHFDSNRMAASNSPEALKWRYATDPNFTPTEDQFRAMGLG